MRKSGRRRKSGSRAAVSAPQQTELLAAVVDHPSDENPMAGDGGGWRVWLGGKVRSGKHTEDNGIPQMKPDRDPGEVREPVLADANETKSFQSDENMPALTADTDDEQNVAVTEKEKPMQTAKQIKPVGDNGISAKAATGEDKPMKEVKASATGIEGDLMSLFGPVIEDDTKGVRNQIRELIQCELQGELGQRFSRNLRIVIRREIAAAVDEQFDRV